MNKMKLEGFLPNIYTYNAIIGGFCRKGQIQEAYKVLRMATSQGLHLDKVTYTTDN